MLAEHTPATMAKAYQSLRGLPHTDEVKTAEKWLRARLRGQLIAPQRGFQERFIASKATVTIGGGNKGPGKSWTLLFGPTRHRAVAGYTSVVFRDKAVQLSKPGGLMTKAQEIHLPMGAAMNKADKKFSYEGGGEFALAHVNGHTVGEHQGIEYAHIGLDEGTHFVYGVFTTLLSCCRSTCGVPATFDIVVNPDISSWVFWYVRPWVDDGSSGYTACHALYGTVETGDVLAFARIAEGEDVPADVAPGVLCVDDVPALDGEEGHRLAWCRPGTPGTTTITYIPGSLADNLYLAGTTYEDQLRQLPKAERERFLYGDWMAQAEPGQFFQREWFRLVTMAEIPTPVTIWRSWDLASRRATHGNRQPDWTVGTLVAECGVGAERFYVVLDVVRMRGTPEDVEQLMRKTWRRDVDWVGQRWPHRPHKLLYEIERGASGAHAIGLVRRHVLPDAEVVGYKVKGTKAERAQPYSRATQQGRVWLLRGKWVETFVREHEKFDGLPNHFDDQVTTMANLLDWRSGQPEGGDVIMGKPVQRRHRRRR
jgi:phage terminase large subunit-like protein